ncbi:MAG: TetR/AcrR family transcriptional regulator [Chloroflexaceae bacterium]|jgi:AcrR family transcriptional regulator|nr:TetR/AcrR family transcriptional regulator [Chloroflexaceae bacterium]
MEATLPPRLSPKGERTREHILETALRLFVEKGYESTTMRDIAAAAETSLGLTYRYFSRKEDLVIAIYQRQTEELMQDVQALPPTTIAQRFELVMQARLDRIGPYRDAVAAFFGAALTPQSGIAVLGDSTSALRQQAGEIFYLVVAGASDAPRKRQTQQLATILYAAHLTLLLFWFNDRSPGYQHTHELIRLTRDVLGIIRPVLGFPPLAKFLQRLCKAITPVFGTIA